MSVREVHTIGATGLQDVALADGLRDDEQGSDKNKMDQPPEAQNDLATRRTRKAFAESINPYSMHEVRFLGMEFNPVVLFVSVSCVLGVVVTAVADPDYFFTKAASSKTLITEYFTWFFVGSQNVWVVFVAYMFLNPMFNNMMLGEDDEVPEFDTVVWFMMILGTAGTGTGLIFYGVGEPIYHLGYNRYVSRGYTTYDELSQEAINLAFYHWGIHAWLCYSLVGVCVGITHHRMGLPLSLRSCFYPILGNKIFGSLGDMIDSLGVITTIMAICASMAIGAVQLNTGMNELWPGIAKSNLAQLLLIAVMTMIASFSVHLGLQYGVRVLSIVSFAVMTTVCFCVFLADDLQYLLNLFVQSVGYHLHHFIDLGFRTDAFAQLDLDVDGKSGPKVWMDWWTVFYWGWWVSWSPFVGVFIARISRGRTIGEVITASMSGPVLYTFIWFSVFGGAGLRMERAAIIDGCLGKCQRLAGGVPFDSRYCKQVFSVSADTQASGALFSSGVSPTALQESATTALFKKRRPDGCESITQLSTKKLDSMWFDVLKQYDNIWGVLVVMSLIVVVLSVVTTNDSGAIVLNIICNNGRTGGHHMQKQMWSLFLGLVSIVLLLVGKSQAILALQTCIVALGLPNTCLVCVICWSIKIAVYMEMHEDTDPSKTVHEGRFDVLIKNDNGFGFWHHSLFRMFRVVDRVLTMGRDQPTSCPSMHDILVIYPTALVAPWYWIGVCNMMLSLKICDSSQVKLFTINLSDHYVVRAQVVSLLCCLIFNTFWALCIASIWVKNLWVLGLALYAFMIVIIAVERQAVISAYNIDGDAIRNLASAFIFYPACIAQMYWQLQTQRPEHAKSTPHIDHSQGPFGHSLGFRGMQVSSSFLQSASSFRHRHGHANGQLPLGLHKDAEMPNRQPVAQGLSKYSEQTEPEKLNDSSSDQDPNRSGPRMTRQGSSMDSRRTVSVFRHSMPENGGNFPNGNPSGSCSAIAESNATRSLENGADESTGFA